MGQVWQIDNPVRQLVIANMENVMEEEHTAKDVARWMVDQVSRYRYMDQSFAVGRIEWDFGKEFIHTNRHGNRAINKDVLNEFEKLTRDTVVWLQRKRTWRLREDGDAPGRKQRNRE